MVDQHAAHERVIFERLRRELAEGRLAAQGLLMPETLELTPGQAAAIEALGDSLERFGFEVEPFGGRTFVLRAVPAVMAGRDAHRVFGEIIEETSADGDGPAHLGLERFEENLLSSLACRAALKAGGPMTLAEMDRLLEDLNRTEIPTHCPHGRPLIFVLEKREIEKRFKRI